MNANKHSRLLDPVEVSKLMTFVAKDYGWRYTADRQTMADQQAEGVAFLWDRLESEGVALLADEVGLGKTFQALGVMYKLLHEKPDARILIFVPRSNISDQWVKQNYQFYKQHLKPGCRLCFGEDEVRLTAELDLPTNFMALQADVEDSCVGSPILKVARTTWFSRLSEESDDLWESKLDSSRKKAAELKERIGDALEAHRHTGAGKKADRKFDLLIVDEAHYYRNKGGESLRAAAASEFFSGVARRVLLLTATPNHSKSHDLQNIISYFDCKGQLAARMECLGEDTDLSTDIMQLIAIRRLKKLGKGVNKYLYRQEVSKGFSFEDDLRAELFFGLYQKQLAETEGGDKRVMHGYLEGLESFSDHNSDERVGDESDSGGSKPGDFWSTGYRGALQKAVAAYTDVFGPNSRPSHPKFNECSSLVVPKMEDFRHSLPEKHLVFVRRIPSGNELAGRVNDLWDDLLISELGAEKKHSRSRQALETRVEKKLKKQSKKREERDLGYDEKIESDLPGADEGNEFSDIQGKILSYFTEQKKGSPRYTVGSRFRKLLVTPRSPFSLFFYPCDPGQDSVRINEWVKSGESAETEKIDYWLSAKKSNGFAEREGTKRKSVLENGLTEFPSVWTLFWKAAQETGDAAELTKIWRDSWMTECRRLALAQFIRAGLLYASPAPVFFLKAYLEVSTSGVEGYKSFVDKMSASFETSIVYHYMAESIRCFQLFCEKQINITDENKLMKESWSLFYNQPPVYFYSAQTRNTSVLNAFNSPFFPATLIGTSVLHEGVDLHRQCRKVLHYGMCWTPGDYEQRIGRVDRMQGLVERLLGDCNSGRCLESILPYLEDSVDEDQLGNIMHKIRRVEKVVDRGAFISFEKEMNANEVCGWEKKLLDPEVKVEKLGKDDPYPYR